MSSSLLTRIERFWPPQKWGEVPLLVAVSGGSDSVAMLRILHAMKAEYGGSGSLVVAHFNHRCRGSQSDEDADWVKSLSEQCDLPLLLGASRQAGLRSEQSLRDERRAFYQEAAQKCAARYLATGHTADDQAETVLFRALRGSGLAGIAGIAPFAKLSEATTLARPLLGCTRCELVGYLESVGQEWRTDTTNASTEWTRNWIRHAILPQAEERLPGASQALVRLAQQAAETQAWVGHEAKALLDRCRQSSDEELGSEEEPGVTLRKDVLAGADPVLAREALRLAWRGQGWPEQSMSAKHWEALLALAGGEAPLEGGTFPGAIEVRSEGDSLCLRPPRLS